MNDHLNKEISFIWENLNWHPSEEQLDQFISLQKLLCKWNETVNLTRLLIGDDYWIGQVFDSLWPFRKRLENSNQLISCIDIGSGCGFPGLAIAIAFPNAKIILVEALNKKTTILKTILKDLNLQSRVIVLTERVELTGQNPLYRSQFDMAMARAVAEGPTTAEYLIPLIKKSGEALLYRGKWNVLDEKRLNETLKYLNSSIKLIEYQKLPKNRGERHLIRLNLYSECPKKYPRKIGLPFKRPLGS